MMVILGLCFLLNDWLSFGEERGRGGVVRLKLDVQGRGTERILDVDGQGGWGVLKIGHFSWTSYAYHPLSDVANRKTIDILRKKLAELCTNINN